MHVAFKFKFGTRYIDTIEGIALFLSFQCSLWLRCVFMPNSIDVPCIWSSFLEECVENICCNETDYSYL